MTDERHLPIELRREIHEDLHAVDARGERPRSTPARRAGEHFLERVNTSRIGEAAAVDVGAVGEQREHAFAAELGEAVHVKVLAVERGLIDLKSPV